MGIIGWISLGIQVVKLIWEIIKILQELRKKDQTFKVGEVVARVNEAIKEHKQTGDTTKLTSIKAELEEKLKHSAVSAPWNTKGLG